MSTKDNLQPYKFIGHGGTYHHDVVRRILDDAHAHYEAQVLQLGGLAKADPARPDQCLAEGDDRVRPAPDMAAIQNLKTPPEAMRMLRDAAQALLDADAALDEARSGIWSSGRDVHKAMELQANAWNFLRAALSAPQPTADERIVEHMRLVYEFRLDDYILSNQLEEYAAKKSKQRAAIEQSARALLSASQEDAEQAAMYRWLRSGIHSLYITTGDLAGDCEDADRVPAGLQGSIADAAIRAAMSAKETK